MIESVGLVKLGPKLKLSSKKVRSLKITTSALLGIFFHAYEISIFPGPVNNDVIFRAGHILLDTFACTFLKLIVLRS